MNCFLTHNIFLRRRSRDDGDLLLNFRNVPSTTGLITLNARLSLLILSCSVQLSYYPAPFGECLTSLICQLSRLRSVISEILKGHFEIFKLVRALGTLGKSFEDRGYLARSNYAEA